MRGEQNGKILKPKGPEIATYGEMAKPHGALNGKIGKWYAGDANIVGKWRRR